MALPEGMQPRPMWPTYFFTRPWPEHGAESPGLIELLYRLRGEAGRNIDSEVAPTAKSADGLFESHFDLFKIDHPGVTKLHAFCRDTVAAAVAHMHSLKPEGREKLTVEINDCWGHITNGGGYHDAHCHTGCSWCGIYYLQPGQSGQTPGGGAPNGLNRFYSPLQVGGSVADFGNNYLSMSYVSPPAEAGSLLLFPSYLWHSGLPYSGEQDRIVISFNSRTVMPRPTPRKDSR